MQSDSNASSTPAIGVYGVSKLYRIYDSPWQRFQGHLIEAMPKPLAIVRRWAQQQLHRLGHEFYAIQNVTFEIAPGESVAIIGRNGSGKSTLLQIIAGTRPPTTGSVHVRGRVAAILELGSGFKPEFTGRENVFIYGAVLGLKKAEIENRFQAIEQFADIGHFVDQPVKTYSSGMLVRLVFAVQVALEPEILILDEALAVGDVFFQQKCARRMQELREKGTTILFVSHSMQIVRNLCEKVVYLKDGHLEFFGPTLEGTNRYFAAAGEISSHRPTFVVSAKDPVEPPPDAVWQNPEKTSQGLAIAWVRVASAVGLGGQIGETLTLEVLLHHEGKEEVRFHFGFSIKNAYDQLVSSSGTHTRGREDLVLAPGARMRVRVDISLFLETGEYTIALGVGCFPDGRSWQRLHGTGWFGPLTIVWSAADRPPPFHGPFGLPVHIEEITEE